LALFPFGLSIMDVADFDLIMSPEVISIFESMYKECPSSKTSVQKDGSSKSLDRFRGPKRVCFAEPSAGRKRVRFAAPCLNKVFVVDSLKHAPERFSLWYTLEDIRRFAHIDIVKRKLARKIVDVHFQPKPNKPQYNPKKQKLEGVSNHKDGGGPLKRRRSWTHNNQKHVVWWWPERANPETIALVGELDELVQQFKIRNHCCTPLPTFFILAARGCQRHTHHAKHPAGSSSCPSSLSPYSCLHYLSS